MALLAYPSVLVLAPPPPCDMLFGFMRDVIARRGREGHLGVRDFSEAAPMRQPGQRPSQAQRISQAVARILPRRSPSQFQLRFLDILRWSHVGSTEEKYIMTRGRPRLLAPLPPSQAPGYRVPRPLPAHLRVHPSAVKRF